jgi:hypothetical protein
VVDAGGTVHVADGNYILDHLDGGTIEIGKNITLLGAQSGVCAIDREGDESIIDAGITTQNWSAIFLNANDINVTIDGFKIIGNKGAVSSQGHESLDDDNYKNEIFRLDEFHFLNNIVEANGSTSSMNKAGLVIVWTDVAEIVCNDISPTAFQPEVTGCNALRLEVPASDPPKTVDVHDNHLHNGTDDSQGGCGLLLKSEYALTDVTVTDNDIYHNGSDGIVMWGQANTISITNNNIYDNALNVEGDPRYGIKFGGFSNTPVINVNCNNIYDNGVGIRNQDEVTVDAEDNWWGDEDGSGPFHDPYGSVGGGAAANGNGGIECTPPNGADWNCDECDENIDGTGDEVYGPSTWNVDYCPWYLNQLFEEDDVPTATGTGTAYFEPDEGLMQGLEAIGVGELPQEAQDSMPDQIFPHGLFAFELCCLEEDTDGCVDVTIELPSPLLPVGVYQYWKWCEGTGWVNLPIGSDDGDEFITIELCDGGAGDCDGVINGVIIDDGGLGRPPFSGALPPEQGETPSVGGDIFTVNKTALIAPWIALAVIIVGGGLFLFRRRVHSVK